MEEKQGKIILFDGVCNFCNFWINRLITLDKREVFRFASLQSDAGKALREKYHITSELDSVILLDDGRYYTESMAILRICKNLGGGWRILYVLKIVPDPIRNGMYRWVAKNRYRLWGKQDYCMMPTPERRRRFLE
ncbi:thiol-disulfide oxidoreductase DCC family protein [Ammoniphilus sp. 3BR4]|uniref:thiol-disulfide oxidoreductase DCC family protein n=1 Tax=Ammoniphilus sp. 3BR4 TaxID=3158265 RepID=UPI0034653CEC